MSKFFNERNPLAGFEDYIGKNKSYKITSDPKQYEQARTYGFLEYNYYRLKKLAALLHKKLFNLGSDEFFKQTQDNYQMMVKKKKKSLVDAFVQPDHAFQKKQEEILLQKIFFRRWLISMVFLFLIAPKL